MITKEIDGKIEYQFITGKTERAIAKDRSGVLELYEAPNWNNIFKKIQKKFNGGK